jgi:hypothetical protein
VNRDKVTDALNKASQETTRLLSARLRTEARKSGWSDDIVKSMTVVYGKDGFTSHVGKKHYVKAQDLEYGTPTTQPTAAVRRFNNRTAEAQDFLVKRLYKHIEDAL